MMYKHSKYCPHDCEACSADNKIKISFKAYMIGKCPMCNLIDLNENEWACSKCWKKLSYLERQEVIIELNAMMHGRNP